MRYCQGCGTAAPERSVYCPACGALLAAVPGTGPVAAPSTPPAAGPPSAPTAGSPSVVAPPPVARSPAPTPVLPPAPAPRSAPSRRTLAIGLGGIALLAVIVVGAWVLAGQRPGGAASPSASTAAAAVQPSATMATTAEPTPGPTLAPTPSTEPTEVPVPTDVPTAVPSPGIPSIVGDTPAEAIGAFLVQRGVDFAGICASVNPDTAPAGAYCADLFEDRQAVQVWRAGAVASEPDTWLLVALTELGWSVAGFAPIDDPTGGPPF